MKKWICLMLCIIILVLFCSCGGNSASESNIQIPQDSSSLATEAKPIETQAPTVAPNYQRYQIKKMECDYSDGMAWAEYSLDNSIGYALINESGEIIYTFCYSDYDKREVYPCVDGLACYTCDKGVYFIDSKGDVVLSYENDENTSYQLAARGGGAIMMYKNIKSFSEDERKVFAVDTKGTPLTEDIKAELSEITLVYERDGKSKTKVGDTYVDNYSSGWKLLKDGIFYCGNPNNSYDEVKCTVFNINTGQFYKVPTILIEGGWGGHTFYYSMYPYQFLDDGSILSLGGMVYTDRILDSADTVIEYLKSSHKRVYCWNNQFTEENHNNKIGEGMHYVGDYDYYYHYYSELFAEVFGGECPALEDIKDGYYDFSGKFITALPTFAEGTKIMNNTCFSGNCAFVFIQGVDKRYYASMFDKTGKILFEPVMVSPYPLDNVEKDFFMGFFKYTDGFLNSEGKTVSFDELPDEVKAYYDPESVKLPTPEYITATAGTKYPSGSKASAVKTAV